MLKAEGKIPDSAIENMMSWHHNGNIYFSNAIWPHDGKALKIWLGILSLPSFQ